MSNYKRFRRTDIRIMTNEEAVVIYKAIPNYSCITPSNLYGENKYDKKVSQFCSFIGFSADIYNKSSRLVKDKNVIIIDTIAYKGVSFEDPEKERKKYHHRGIFNKLIKKITEDLDLSVVIWMPNERMREICIKQGLSFID